jgi:hypothetical protein
MRITPIFILFLLIGCGKNQEEPISHISFGQPQKVNIICYADNVMEPFLSRDGTILFFNNLNNPSVNTNIFFASKITTLFFNIKERLKVLTLLI